MEDETGQMVWQPAEGGQAVSAEEWSRASTGEAGAGEASTGEASTGEAGAGEAGALDADESAGGVGEPVGAPADGGDVAGMTGDAEEAR